MAQSAPTKKIKSFNPYFNNRIVSNDPDSLAKLSPNCLFFISKASTAISYAIFHCKPVIHIYSSQWLYEPGEFKAVSIQSKNTGKRPFDISKIKLTDFESNISTQSYSDIHLSNYVISDLNILAPNEQINQFFDSKYGLLLEIESRLPDLDNRQRKAIYDLQKIPLTLILLKLFLIP